MCEYYTTIIDTQPNYDVCIGIGSEGGLYLWHVSQQPADPQDCHEHGKYPAALVSLSPSVVQKLKQVLAEHYPDPQPKAQQALIEGQTI